MLNILERDNPSLDALGCSEILKTEDEATIFILHYYGQHRKPTLTEEEEGLERFSYKSKSQGQTESIWVKMPSSNRGGIL